MENLDNEKRVRTKTRCGICEKPICPEHTFRLGPDCFSKLHSAISALKPE